MKYALHIAQALCLVGAEVCDGDACPRRHHLGDVLGGNKAAVADPDPCRGLVGEVDGLVRQAAVAYIPRREIHRGLKRGVGYLDPVVRLKALAHAAEHGKALGSAGLGYLHRLEPALERGVLFDVAAVLLRRRGADYLHLAPAERGLEDVRRVYRALGAAGADYGVQLVDEEYHVAGFFNVLEHGLDALLEIAAVFRSGQQRGQVEGDEPLSRHAVRSLAVGDVQGDALGDGGFADARLTDEHGVVFAAAREYLHAAAYLLAAAYDGVYAAGGGELGEVAAVLVENACLYMALRGFGTALGLGPGTPRAHPEHRHDVGVDIV